MNGLIVYPLVILMVVGGFSQLFLFSNLDMSTSQTFSSSESTGSQTVDGETSEYTGDSTTTSFTMVMATGLIVLITLLVVVGAVAGIKVLGSGLDTYSVQLIHKACAYYGFWGIFSGLSFYAFSTIPSGFGLFLWLGMTLIYTLGFYQTLGSGGGD